MKKEQVEKIKSATIVILVLIIVFGASYFISELQECNNGNNDISLEEQEDLNEIGIDDYLSLKEGSEASIIYIARPTCYYCQQMEPIVKNIVQEYGVKVNYLNTDELDDEGQYELIKSDDYFSEGYATPLLLVVKDNEIIDIQEGLTDKDVTINFLKDNGLIS